MYVLCTSNELKQLLSELGDGYGYWKANDFELRLIKREKNFIKA